MSTTPEDRIPRSSSLCSLGPRPYIMTQLLILALREHFSCAANIEHEVFRARLWTSDETTKIQVEDETVWKPEQAGKRPAIVVKRNEWKCTKLGIGDVSGTTAQGFRELIAMWHGSHTLFCIAKMDKRSTFNTKRSLCFGIWSAGSVLPLCLRRSQCFAV